MGIQNKKAEDSEPTLNDPFSINDNDKNAVKYHLKSLKQSVIYFSYHLWRFLVHTISAFYYLLSDTMRSSYDKIPAEIAFSPNTAVLYRDVLITNTRLPDPPKTFYAEVGIKT